MNALPPESDGGALVNEGGKLVIRRASYALRKGSDGYEHVIYEKQYWNATVSAWGLDIRDAMEYQPVPAVEKMPVKIDPAMEPGTIRIETPGTTVRCPQCNGVGVTSGRTQALLCVTRLTRCPFCGSKSYVWCEKPSMINRKASCRRCGMIFGKLDARRISAPPDLTNGNGCP